MTFFRSYLFFIAAAVLCCTDASAQKPPRLVVVVSFDQYRGDYPTSFSRFVGSRGFARMQKDGATFSQCYYEHASNLTGPGHASLLTGCYPSHTGIVGNDFCDIRTDECVYCVADADGAVSATQLEMPTVGDKLRERDPRSKVVGVSLKDRAAILMCGKGASTCVWFDDASGTWTTSQAFPRPTWLTSLNKEVSCTTYSKRQWTMQIPASLDPAYDSVRAEGAFAGGDNAFPHDVLPATSKDFVASVMLSPFSMDMVFDAASMALKKERLGKDGSPDLLCVGVSTTDYVGHVFGPDSREVQELYVRADKRIERFIDELDQRVGRANYVLIITSDHGVAPIPEVIRDLPQQQGARIDAGRVMRKEIRAIVDSVLTLRFGPPRTSSYVRAIHAPSLYLNDTAVSALNRAEVLATSVGALRKHPGLGIVTTRDTLALGDCPDGTDEATCRYLRNSFHAARTGDIVLYPKRYWVFGTNTATHGTPHDYDRYVPMMLLGGRIKPQRSKEMVAPVDIAPTIAAWFGLSIGPVDGSPLPLK
ncbi:MAG: alkaline phosphatase family protein [Ignavibacteria bacterium]|nr:alkaline phosphatase family protein [Ignavibacteria bacterium]MBP6510346.1 alkaline phosphatase family protein [Candidatus Kapabacteria bacterium]MBK6419755.1 alkaline phosphatase family protein [Ignavibacteria bacterium]MBK6759614.1 alkaline phosphatase family protein [Ignavibacteria bacterium]MBK7184505.1 alkaline phosphatase family protein [Ignavibacteria bacterium]